MKLKHLLRRLADRFLPGRFPRMVQVQTVLGKNPVFEVTNSVEAFRVEEMGGEEEFVNQIHRELKPSDVFFDVGSCVGLVAVPAMKAGITVVAFEPDPAFRGRLRRNLELNRLDSSQVVEWAVSEKSGEAKLYTDGIGGTSPSLRPSRKRKSVTVKTKSIDAALEEGEIPFPTVIKMDIEGAEILALRGMKRLLNSEKAPRFIFIETHPEFLSLFGSSEEEVLKIIQSSGYQMVHGTKRDAQQHYGFRLLSEG